jgi:hypothetical protein
VLAFRFWRADQAVGDALGEAIDAAKAQHGHAALARR